jgi:hypothetical protein
LQRAMDARCNVNCPTLKSQSAQQAMQCTKAPAVKEDVDGCKSTISLYAGGELTIFRAVGDPWAVDGFNAHVVDSTLYLGIVQDHDRKLGSTAGVLRSGGPL